MIALYALGWVLLSLGGDLCFKKASGIGDVHMFIGCAIYALCGVPAYISYRHGDWSSIALYWAMFSIIISMIVGRAIFHDEISVRRVRHQYSSGLGPLQDRHA